MISEINAHRPQSNDLPQPENLSEIDFTLAYQTLIGAYLRTRTEEAKGKTLAHADLDTKEDKKDAKSTLQSPRAGRI